jgi:hypothetical protein
VTDRMPDHSTMARRWFTRRWARRAFIAVCLVVVVVQTVVIVHRRETHWGDYDDLPEACDLGRNSHERTDLCFNRG